MRQPISVVVVILVAVVAIWFLRPGMMVDPTARDATPPGPPSPPGSTAQPSRQLVVPEGGAALAERFAVLAGRTVHAEPESGTAGSPPRLPGFDAVDGTVELVVAEPQAEGQQQRQLQARWHLLGRRDRVTLADIRVGDEAPAHALTLGFDQGVLRSWGSEPAMSAEARSLVRQAAAHLLAVIADLPVGTCQVGDGWQQAGDRFRLTAARSDRVLFTAERLDDGTAGPGCFDDCTIRLDANGRLVEVDRLVSDWQPDGTGFHLRRCRIHPEAEEPEPLPGDR